MNENFGFWAPGSSKHLDALASAEAIEVAALEERLQSASPEEQETIVLALKEVRARYADERRSSLDSLYLTGN